MTVRSVPHVLFRSGEGTYALPLELLAEVTIAPAVHLIPFVDPARAGIVNVKGEPLPAVHSRPLLQGEPAGPANHVLVLERGALRVGLLAEFVARVERAPEVETIEEPPPGPAFVEWLRLEGETVGFLEPDELMNCIAERVASPSVQPVQSKEETTCPSAF